MKLTTLNEIQIYQYSRPFRVAIKALIATHLPPLLPLVAREKREDTPAMSGEVLGVLFPWKTPIPHKSLIGFILDREQEFGRSNQKDITGIKAAVNLHSKLQSLEALLKNHPDPNRVPMMRNQSEVPPLPEDREINDLLQEARTLGQIYDRDFIVLLQEGPLS